MWREHVFEIAKTIGVVLLSVFVSVVSYLWHSSVQRLDAEINYNRKYIDLIAERIRAIEIAASAAQVVDIGISQRLERLEELNYGYRRKDK